MSITVTIDSNRYRHALNQFVYELKADAVLLLKEEMRLLLRDVVRFTPPMSLAQGRKAVARDVSKAIGLLDQSSFGRAKEDYRERMRALIAKKDNATIQKILRSTDSRPWVVKSFAPSDHEKARNRYGRVPKRTYVSTTDARQYKQHLASVMSRVGWARAGWASAARGVGFNLPSWVARHAGKAGSAYAPPSQNKLEIEATNRASKIPNYYERHVLPAMRARVKSVESEVKRLLGGGKSRRGSLANTPTGQAN